MEEVRHNPYTFGPPVQDPSFFFGREYELDIMVSTVTQLAPGLRQSMALIGPRRIGKTSLLFEFKRRMEASKNIVASVSTEQFELPSPMQLTTEILSVLRESAKSKDSEIAQMHFDLLDDNTPTEERVFQIFRRDLQRLNDRLADQQKPPAILIIDEVEGLVAFGLRVLGLFRDLAQSLPYVLFMVAGSDRLYQLVSNYTSPFYNVFKIINVKPLDEKEAVSMIIQTSSMGNIEFEEPAIEKVVHISGGVPYLINMICHYAVNRAIKYDNPMITSGFIEFALNDIFTHQKIYFESMWGDFNRVEKIILYHLAFSEGMDTISDITDKVISVIDINEIAVPINDVVIQLRQRQVLTQGGDGGYRLSNTLLQIWLSRHYTMDRVLSESTDHDSGDIIEKKLIRVDEDDGLRLITRAARVIPKIKIENRLSRLESIIAVFLSITLVVTLITATSVLLIPGIIPHVVPTNIGPTIEITAIPTTIEATPTHPIATAINPTPEASQAPPAELFSDRSAFLINIVSSILLSILVYVTRNIILKRSFLMVLFTLWTIFGLVQIIIDSFFWNVYYGTNLFSFSFIISLLGATFWCLWRWYSVLWINRASIKEMNELKVFSSNPGLSKIIVEERTLRGRIRGPFQLREISITSGPRITNAWDLLVPYLYRENYRTLRREMRLLFTSFIIGTTPRYRKVFIDRIVPFLRNITRIW